MTDLTIHAEGAGYIEVGVTQRDPDVSLHPALNPLDVKRETRDVYMAEEDKLKEATEDFETDSIAAAVLSKVLESAASKQDVEQAKKGILQKYSIDQYNELKHTGNLENKMYCVYTKSRLDYIYIGRTLVAKRADAGEAVTITRFPMIFPIIFA